MSKKKDTSPVGWSKWKDWQRVLFVWNQVLSRNGMTVHGMAAVVNRPVKTVWREMARSKFRGLDVFHCDTVGAPVWQAMSNGHDRDYDYGDPYDTWCGDETCCPRPTGNARRQRGFFEAERDPYNYDRYDFQLAKMAVLAYPKAKSINNLEPSRKLMDVSRTEKAALTKAAKGTWDPKWLQY